MQDVLEKSRIQFGYVSVRPMAVPTSVTLLLIRWKDDKLAQAQSHLVGVTPKGIHRNVTDKVIGVDIASLSLPTFEQSDELPSVFVFLSVSTTKFRYSHAHSCLLR